MNQNQHNQTGQANYTERVRQVSSEPVAAPLGKISSPGQEKGPAAGSRSGNPDSAQQYSTTTSAVQRFGNYDLVHRIGIGGMGEVYLARQRTAFGREVAVKIIRSDLMHDITVRKRFLREAEVNAYLKHDHILPLVEFGEEKGRLFLVTPYIKGGTLSKRLRGGSLTLAETYELFTALVQAVAYLHKRDVIHRDLKPSNVLLDHEEGSERIYVRLIDFGIASLQGLIASAPLTTAGHEMGTEAYMAPERLSGIAAPSNDIYSLGVILYQMLTGKLPDNAGGTAFAQDTMLPEPLTEVVQQSTAPDPSKRYASAEELLRAFEHAYRSLSLSHFRVSASSPEHPPIGRNSSARMPLVTPQPQVSSPAPVRPMSNERPARPPVTPVANGQMGAQPYTPSTPNFPPTMGGSKAYPARPSNIASLHSEVVLPPLPDKTGPFKGEDYEAPTSYISPQPVQKSSTTSDHPIPARQSGKVVPRPKQKKPGTPVATIISVIIIVIVFVIGGMAYSIYQAFDTATITITPRVETVKTTVTLTAKVNQTSVDSNAGIIPAQMLNSMQNASKSGNTTGLGSCTILPLNCSQTVSEDDVHNLVTQIRPSVKSQIAQDIRQQAQTQGGMPIGDILYMNETDVANPQVGSTSNTVTVTVTLQGSQEYVKNADVRTVAAQKLQGQVKPSYTLIDTTVKIGQPVVQSVDRQGNAQIRVAAGAVSHYTITDNDRSGIQNAIAGKSQKDAPALIAAQNPNLDPNKITIRINYGGDHLPGSGNRITVNEANLSNMSPVQLPTI
jgi:serine/threonine protein kinase